MGILNIIKKIFANSPETEKKAPELHYIGIVEAICPYCGVELEKKPSRKIKCPDCGNFIFVRTSPLDMSKILITEDEIEKIEEQWAIYNNTHEEFLEQKKRFENERDILGIKFGRTPSENDVKWSLLNNELLLNAQNGNWGFYRNTKFAMAKILAKEERHKDALLMYLEVYYLDLNGPNNTGGLKYYKMSPFSTDLAVLAPGVVKLVIKLIKLLNLDELEVKKLFYRISNRLGDSLKLPVVPKKAWTDLSNEIFN